MVFGRETLRNLASDVLNDFRQFLKIAGKIMDIGAKIGILSFYECREVSASLHWRLYDGGLGGERGKPSLDTAFDHR